MHYFDNSATTKPCQAAVEAVTNAVIHGFGNPSSMHSLGTQSDSALKSARKNTAAALGCQPEEVYFTSGGTEADNWAIIRGAELNRHRGRHIITTSIEHHAILEPAKWLEAHGYEVTYLQPDKLGSISVESLEAALRKETVLVSVMMVNNETGAVNDIAAMAKSIKAAGSEALLHTDAVQGFMKIPFKFKTLGADMISVSAHKIHGIKGCGALTVRKGLNLKPLLLGGGQERGMRSGTEALPAIEAMGAACLEGLPSLRRDIAQMTAYKEQIIEKITEILPEAVIIGAHDAPHIINVALPGVRSQGIINCLQEEDIFVSAGSACAKGKRSHVLSAMNVDGTLIDGSIRVSLSRFTNSEDAEVLPEALKRAYLRLR